MSRKLLTLLLMMSLAIADAQFSECIEVDFETIDGSVPFEGLIIRDQFLNEFGLLFSREDGGFPVIAEVGTSPATAFASFWGENTPAPGVDIGRFFLTDDGFLTGTDPPPLILTFDSPLDSISGCNLDIDGGERFIIQARDIDENVISEFIIQDGDPGTGDGRLTCWGFNLESCEEKIYSVRLEGTRPFPSFGLGIDNLSFCFSVTAVETNTTCNNNNGIIELSTSGIDFEYSLDGDNFQTSPIFDGLPPGIYEVFVRDNNGCVYTLTAPVFDIPPAEITNEEITHTTCGEDNGMITLALSPSAGSTYSIDNLATSQQSPTFDNLAPGDYTIIVSDLNDCVQFYNFTIDPSIVPSIAVEAILDETCFEGNGSIQVSSITTDGNPTYLLNGDSNQDSPFFSDLSQGEYFITVIDGNGCSADTSATVGNLISFEISDAVIEDATCGERTGAIEVIANGGTGNLTYSIDSSGIFQVSNEFEDIPPGLHTILINDDQGCLLPLEVEIDIPDCPIFTPNIFCPTCGDRDNAEFSIASTPLYDICILKFEIYDRWGNLIYIGSKKSIHDQSGWWDGTFDGVPAEIGVYVYVIEVLHENGTQETLSGDITLMR